MNPPPLLSVVVICRNQRERVVACVRSVLGESFISGIPREILVVDSASTDGTREALAGLPVRWAGIGESPLLCASLGRRVGTERSVGEFILFLDGDMELAEGFVSAALRILEADREIAGVAGQVMEEDPSAPGTMRDRYRILEEGEAKRFGGACLFRRDLLAAAGGFDPYIFNREENELHSRLRRSGWTVRQIPVPMAFHRDVPRSPAEKLLREIVPGRNRPLGRAQAFLRSLAKGNALPYIRQEWLFFFSLATDMLSASALFFLPHPARWGVMAGLQAVSFLVQAIAWSPGQYVLNKLAALQFLAGLFLAPRLLRRPLPDVTESW